ncbi:MAG: hypothetical protein KC910_12140 [Candidatus Eremiobacteraeota bacterium]|nr:hypothetical protein [Candidatus Eremiobacteraeota bacterium]
MVKKVPLERLVAACLTDEPGLDPDRARSRALRLQRNLFRMDRAWEKSQRRFYNSDDLVFIGAGTAVNPTEAEAIRW